MTVSPMFSFCPDLVQYVQQNFLEFLEILLRHANTDCGLAVSLHRLYANEPPALLLDSTNRPLKHEKYEKVLQFLSRDFPLSALYLGNSRP